MVFSYTDSDIDLNQDTGALEQSDPGLIDRSPAGCDIRAARKEAGLSVSASAEIVSKSRRTWIDYENGRLAMAPSLWNSFLAAVEDKANAGDLVVANEDWIQLKEVRRLLGRSSSFVRSLVEEGSIRRVYRHGRLALYNKIDVRLVRREVLARELQSSVPDRTSCTHTEVVEKLGSKARLNLIAKQGALKYCMNKEGEKVYDREAVERVLKRVEEESNLLSLAQLAKQVGISRQALHQALKAKRILIEGVDTLLNGKRYPATSVQDIMSQRGRD